MSLATSNRDGGRTSESGHLRAIQKVIAGEVLSGLNATQRAAGANMSVDVQIGDAVIPRSDATYGHPAWNDAVLNKTINTADVSNPRRDIVILYIDYNQAPSTGVSNNTNGVVKCTVVAGTPAGSPSDPSDATLQSAAGSGNPYIKLARVRVGTGVTSISNSVIDDLRTMAYAVDNGGWNALSAAWDSWAYSAWDNTNKIATITVPDSTIFTLGQKVRYWQLTGGWKYGFVVRKPNGTSIQVYQGHTNGYTLNNERVYLPAYSRDKAPDGFPLDPAVWTVELIDTSDRSQSSPSNGTWYNPGALNIGVPIGIWDVEYQATAEYTRSGQNNLSKVTLSTANNSQSDASMTTGASYAVAATTSMDLVYPVMRRKRIALTANTTYYLNIGAFQASATAIAFLGSSVGSTVIRAVCAYL